MTKFDPIQLLNENGDDREVSIMREEANEIIDEITRLRAEVERKDAALTILSDHFMHGYGGPTRADVIRAVQDIALAALTAQEKDTQS